MNRPNKALQPTSLSALRAARVAAEFRRYAYTKMNKKNVQTLFALLLLVLPMPTTAAEYKSGQVWKYKTRPGEENSLVYIVKVDRENGYGNIYHIYVDGLKIRNAKIKGGIQSQLPHAPVDEKTLNYSVTALL